MVMDMSGEIPVPDQQPYRTVSIIGLGLIGGSLARALKQHTKCCVCGFDINPETLHQASLAGVVDVAAGSLKQAVEMGDIVFLCLPVRSIMEAMLQAQNWWKVGAVVTDVASTKQALVRAAGNLIPSHACYVGGHPMAGSEKSGFAAGNAELFHGRPWVLTGLTEAARSAREVLADLLRRIGAVPLLLDPEEHDEVTAKISHIPHILAGALTLLNFAEDYRNWGCRLAANGFLDMTRIAESDTSMWVDICLTNTASIVTALLRLEKILAEFRIAVAQQDEARIKAFFAQSKAKHRLFAEAAAGLADKERSNKHE